MNFSMKQSHQFRYVLRSHLSVKKCASLTIHFMGNIIG
jgi:hypothetical protein